MRLWLAEKAADLAFWLSGRGFPRSASILLRRIVEAVQPSIRGSQRFQHKRRFVRLARRAALLERRAKRIHTAWEAEQKRAQGGDDT